MAKWIKEGQTIKVEKGDTLWGIASSDAYKSYIAGSTTNDKINTLVKLNNIKNKDYITVGQILKLTGTADTEKGTTSSQATIKTFGILSRNDREVYADWTWTKSNTDGYEVLWEYSIEVLEFVAHSNSFILTTKWVEGQRTTIKTKYSTYTAPTEAQFVRFKVKPISQKHTVNGKETAYWTASWSTLQTWYFGKNPPKAPPKPTLTIEPSMGVICRVKLELTGLDADDLNAYYIDFRVSCYKIATMIDASGTYPFKDKFVWSSGQRIKITNGTAIAYFNLNVGFGYMFDIRSVKEAAGDKYADGGAAKGPYKFPSLYSAWTGYYDGNDYFTATPGPPNAITTIKPTSETSVYIEWGESAGAATYDIQYTDNKDYIDSSDRTQIKTDIDKTYYEITGLEKGTKYYFRVRGVNDTGESAWSEISSIAIGSTPIAPTTWSSKSTAMVGETVTLSWTHNCEDGSDQTLALLQIYVDDSVTPEDLVFETPESSGVDKVDPTSSYMLDTSKYRDGAKIRWCVRTAGVTRKYGEPSIFRQVNIYDPTILSIGIADKDENQTRVISEFPFYISAIPSSSNIQKSIGYSLVITANEGYETVDDVGNRKIVKSGGIVYSRTFTVSSGDDLLVEMTPSNIDLENNISYTAHCSVTMDSGLTAEKTVSFTVQWNEDKCEPNAEIGIDTSDYSAIIRPYCEDENNVLIENVLLSVYRREFDGTFTEIATDIFNTGTTVVTDPHPALDYARYRIVATYTDTGAVSHCDLAGYPVGGKAILIQWDETWSSFDMSPDNPEAILSNATHSSSMLRLPYNIDVSDSYDLDVKLIEYVGRRYPVSYYGTQVGAKSTWNTVIPKTDEETLYGLRKLALWTGDVYVREPSGSGYWANVKVSFNQEHKSVSIPVTLMITRVEGGM